MEMEICSDDSDFYGSQEEKQSLQDRVDRFDFAAWSKQHQTWGCGYPQRHRELPHDSPRLHNPYAGVHYAWQLTETLEDFFARLPPATTDQSHEVPWIFICNPYVPRERKQEESSQGFVKGNEDEAPAETGSQLALVVQGGMERLELLAGLKQKVEQLKKSAAFINRELFQERKQTTTDILDLAHAGKVRTGKWMIFCSGMEVNAIWETVAKATANNELGIAAKVAPRPEFDDARKDRLICVYTKDFKDMTDVGRVLHRLKELKLVASEQKTIYYKPDIFTYLGIAHGNPWGLGASIFSSNAFLSAVGGCQGR